MDTLKKFLLGNYSLTKTFWIIYFIPTISYAIFNTLLVEFDENYSSPWIIIFLLLVFKIVCFVAIWNSSTKYTGKKRWFYLVRIYLAFEFVVSFVRLISLIPILLVVLSK